MRRENIEPMSNWGCFVIVLIAIVIVTYTCSCATPRLLPTPDVCGCCTDAGRFVHVTEFPPPSGTNWSLPMHDNVRHIVRNFLASAIPIRGSVLDVGGADVNGSCADLWRESGFEYSAADIVRSPGVRYEIPADGGFNLGKTFNVVFSTSTLEHVKRPWNLVQFMAKHVAPGGWLFLIIPFSWPYHCHPIDCWRVGPDGMKVLFEEAGIPLVECGLHTVRQGVQNPRNAWGVIRYVIPAVLSGTYVNYQDCYGWGRKDK